MGFTSASNGLQMGFTWASHGLHMGFTWASHRLHIGFKWALMQYSRQIGYKIKKPKVFRIFIFGHLFLSIFEK
jgi:hypothetical protein